MTKKSQDVYQFLNEKYPNACCALHFFDDFSCLVSIVLSAQTTDKAVNNVTPILFEKFPNSKAMAEANVKEIESIISRLGLAHNKAKNISELSKEISNKYRGIIPSTREELLSLPGVGIKTANVFLAERRGVACIPVDTHISRIAKRLRYAKEDDSVEQIEKKLESSFPKELPIKLHHQIISFGRDICNARSPRCEECKLTAYCKEFKTSRSKVNK